MEIQGSTQRIAESALRQAITDPESFEQGHVRQFVRFFEHGDQTVRLTASWTFGLIVSANPEVVVGSVKPLASMLESEPQSTHADITRTLGYIETEYPQLVREAIEELDISDDAYKKRVINAIDSYEPSGEGKVQMTAGPATEYEGLGAVAPETNDTNSRTTRQQQPSRPPTSPPPTPPAVDARRSAFEPVDSQGSGSHVSLWQVTYKTRAGTHTALLKQLRHSAPPAFDSAFHETLSGWQAVDDHDSIVPVVAHGTIPKPWFVVEYQEGQRLSERLDEIGRREARWIIDRLVDAVVNAHGAGVLHGGLTPRHVIFSLTYEEDNAWAYPKLSNWGIPQLLCQLTALPMGVPPQYAAPEQIKAEQFGSIDASTDIYHLGLLIYELLAGRLPFEGQPGVLLQKAITEEPPPPSYYNSNIPTEVDVVISKALRKSKLYRYNTAQDFQTELRDAMSGGRP